MDVLTALQALPKAPFFFLRHGETDWNRGRLAQGQADIPLNQAGQDQADQARPVLDGHGAVRIITSPLKRASETAEIVNRTLNLTIDRHSGLMERSFGPFEGKPWVSGFVDSELEGAEPHPQFMERILTTLVEALERPGPPLLVSHGGVFKIIVELLCTLPDARAANAVPFRFDPPAGPVGDDTRWRVSPVDPLRSLDTGS